MRIAMTGTAIQNNLTEFWVLLDWTNPGSVGTHKQWATLVSDPLAAGQARNAQGHELERAKMVKTNLHDKLLPLYFLRRSASPSPSFRLVLIAVKNERYH